VVNAAGIMAENKADEIILDPAQIARHYVRSWFVLDLISSLPLDYTITLLIPDAGSFSHLLHAGPSNHITRIVRGRSHIPCAARCCAALVYKHEKRFTSVTYQRIVQGWANCGPRATCGPPEYIMRPVGMLARFLKFYSECLNHNQ